MSWKVVTRRRAGWSLLVVAAIASAGAVGFVIRNSAEDGAGTAGSPGLGANSATPPATRSAVAGNALPDGPVQVLGVEVAQPVADAGRVPLNTAVQREWRLRNTGTTPVSLGRPGIEVLEGC